MSLVKNTKFNMERFYYICKDIFGENNTTAGIGIFVWISFSIIGFLLFSIGELTIIIWLTLSMIGFSLTSYIYNCGKKNIKAHEKKLKKIKHQFAKLNMI